MDMLIQQTAPAFESFFIEEPRLVFAGGGLSVDPKEGMERFGPYEADKGAKRVIRVGVVGTGVGIQTFAAYLERCRGRVQAGFSDKGKPYDVLCFPDFPGSGDDQSLRCSFVTDSSIQRIVPDEYFKHAVKPPKESAKLQGVVELVTKELAALADLESAPDVVAFVMPKVVEDECATVGDAFRGVKVKLTRGQKFERKLQKGFVTKGQSFLKLDFDVCRRRQRRVARVLEHPPCPESALHKVRPSVAVDLADHSDRRRRHARPRLHCVEHPDGALLQGKQSSVAPARIAGEHVFRRRVVLP
jgi:hypothetical protein